MSAPPFQRDLVALVADADIEQGLRGVFSRVQSLRVRAFTFHLLRHPERDPGCLLRSSEFLRMYQGRYAHALVVFDRDGCGRSEESREQIERSVEERLGASGWADRAAAIVIDPELESWVWSDSPQVDVVLGWGPDPDVELRQWLRERLFLVEEATKPARPKEALEAVLQRVRRVRSPALYRQLAEKVSLERCIDASFLKLRQTLFRWFAEA